VKLKLGMLHSRLSKHSKQKKEIVLKDLKIKHLRRIGVTKNSAGAWPVSGIL
jgi:hypothetical protein